MKKKTFFNYLVQFGKLLLIGVTIVSCSEIVNEENISDSQIVLIAPTDDSMLNASKVQFIWEEVSGATSYRLQVFYPNFSQAQEIVLDTLISKPTFQHIFNNLDESVLYPYQWRVKALNFAYETEYKYGSFSIKLNDGTGFVNQQVILIAPVQGYLTNKPLQELTWNKIDGAVDYRIQIWKPDTSGTLLFDTNTTSTGISHSFPDGIFQWRVRAQNSYQNTDYTYRALTVDTVVPNTAILQAPQQNSELAVGAVSFSWQRTPVAGSAETDSIYVYSNALQNQLVFKAKSSNFTHTENMVVGTYYWKVKSFDEAGNSGNFSSAFSFAVK